MLRSETIDQLAPALVAAQAEITPAEKDGINPHFGRKYATLGAVMDAIRPALSKHGLAVSQIVNRDGDVLALETILLHTSGQYIGGTYPLRPTKNDPQGEGSALTYARRYALAGLLGVIADDDDDGNAGSRPATKPPERRFERRATPNTVVAPKAPPAPTAPATPPPDEFDTLPSASTDPQRAAVLAKGDAKRNGNGHQAADLPTRPTWHSPDEAKAWAAKQVDAAGQLVFAHGKHVANSYDLQRRRYLDDNGDKATASGFFDAWYAHVQTKIAEANAKLSAELDAQAAASETPRF